MIRGFRLRASFHLTSSLIGSLLGLELHKQTSFPVGKVQFMTLYPMSFLEFLDALGESALTGFIEKRDWDNVNLFAAKLKDLLKQYYYVGGMHDESYRRQKAIATQSHIPLHGHHPLQLHIGTYDSLCLAVQATNSIIV